LVAMNVFLHVRGQKSLCRAEDRLIWQYQKENHE